MTNYAAILIAICLSIHSLRGSTVLPTTVPDHCIVSAVSWC